MASMRLTKFLQLHKRVATAEVETEPDKDVEEKLFRALENHDERNTHFENHAVRVTIINPDRLTGSQRHEWCRCAIDYRGVHIYASGK